MSVDAVEIMNISADLLERYPEAFSDDFGANKRTVEQLTDIRTHHTRNRIAGRITRQQSDEPAGE